jgi:arylsulfatase A-like enzyme
MWKSAAVLLSAGLVACGAPIPVEAPRATRGYVLISLDTLRADHLGCYGYARPTSPFLDRLAERAVLFENAIVQYPSTLTSHMSIFTGLYPAEHGVYPPDSVLAPAIETLPEAFRRAGYRTAGFTEGGFVHGRFGFRRGFDVFAARDRRDSDEVERTFARGRRFLRGLEGGERFFLFIHTYAVHAPYDPPEEYRRLFWPGEPPPGAFPPTGPELSRVNALGETLPDAVRDYFKALYDAEIRRLDDVLRRFFAELDELGLADDTTVVVTSDHGEEFGEHGKLNHTQLYREVLRAPLLIVHPDLAAGRRHAPPVESVDLAPTLYELARVKPRGAPSGASLAPLLAGPSLAAAAPAAGDAYAEVAGGSRSLFSFADGALSHLLVIEPPPRQWATRRLRLAADGGRLAFEVRSFAEERALEVWDDGVLVTAAAIGPRWSRLTLELPPGRRTLELTSPDCTLSDAAPAVVCLSFQVRGVPLARAELYDVGADPAERHDVVGERPELARSLYARLTGYASRPAAQRRVEELDEKLRSELEALGYLQ